MSLSFSRAVRLRYLSIPVILAGILACGFTLAQDMPFARYDEKTSTLCLRTTTKYDCHPLSHDSIRPVYFDVKMAGRPRGAAFYSRASYRAYGQINPGVIILWEGMHSKELYSQKPDRARRWLTGKSPGRVFVQDASFAHLYSLLDAHNSPEPGIRYCGGYHGAGIMAAVLARQCHTDCGGLSVVLYDFFQDVVPVRLVTLNPMQIMHEDGVRLMSSEAHTTIELYDESWYVADPSFGFAYVLAGGKRLDAKSLIAALAKDGSGKGLTFAAVKNERIHLVGGEVFIRHNPSMWARYYTADKRVAHMPRKPQ